MSKTWLEILRPGPSISVPMQASVLEASLFVELLLMTQSAIFSTVGSLR